ncbi:hypothetical protein D3C81_1287510 [compost metagenome]
MVEDFALGAIAGFSSADVVATHVGHAVAQARHAVGTEVDGVADLPGALVLGVEVRPVGVGQPDGAAAVAQGAGRYAVDFLVEAVVVAGVTGAALVGEGEGVGVDRVGRGQAPDGVVAVATVELVGEVAIQLGLVAVEVEGQRLLLGQRLDVVQVDVLLLRHVLVVGAVQRGAQVVGELVAAAEHVDALQVTAVAAFGALADFLGEAAEVQLQAFDLLGGDHGAVEGFRQQAGVVVGQHRQGGHLVADLDHGVGDTRLDGGATTGQVVGGVAAVTLLEEVDAGSAAAALAAVQTHGVHAEGVDAYTHGARGEAGSEGGGCRLAPLGLVFGAVLEVAVHVAIAQEQVQVAVFNEALGVGLIVGHRLVGGGEDAQSEQADPFVQHLVRS